MIEETDEDVHSAIERLLGPVGRKIHAGRSRNDQVVTAFRLWAARRVRGGEGRRSRRSRGAVLDRAEEDAETVMPGYTHLQRAQPVTLGHHLLAWVEMLDRDRDRFALAAAHAEPSPLGAGALAGTTLPLPKACATRSTRSPTATSRSTTSTRARRCSSTSRGSARSWRCGRPREFGFVRLPESAATGSSMMPQKLNPDVAELARGKAGTAIGRLTGLLATVKGLPLAVQLRPRRGQAGRRSRRGATCAWCWRRWSVLVRDLGFDERAAGGGGVRSRACSRPTPPRRSSRRASRSATRTSRWPGRCAKARSTRIRAPPRALPRGSATSRRRSPKRGSASRSAPRTVPAGTKCREPAGSDTFGVRPYGEGLAQREPAAPERAADDGALAAEVAERDEVVEVAIPPAASTGTPASSTSESSPRSGPASEPSRRVLVTSRRCIPAVGALPGRARRGVTLGLGHPAVGDDAAILHVDGDDDRSSKRAASSEQARSLSLLERGGADDRSGGASVERSLDGV